MSSPTGKTATSGKKNLNPTDVAEQKKKSFWKPTIILLGIPVLCEIAESVLDAWKGDGNGVIDKIDTPLTVYQLISTLLFLLFLAMWFSEKGRKGWSKLTFSVAVLLFLLLIAEGVARVIYNFSDRRMYTVEGFRLSRPAPYADATYFSEEFVKESTQKLQWETPAGTNLILPVDFEGRYIHVRDQLRVTSNQPASCEKRILVFGGSTIFCNEVPDSFTVCSYLQRMVEEKFPGRYCVMNYGVASVNTAQQWERLKMVPVDSNDVVLMYDGVNDIFNTLYSNNPGGTIFQMQKDAYESSGTFRFFYKIMNRFRGSRLVQLLFDPYTSEAPAHLANGSMLSELGVKLLDQYTGYTAASRDYCYDNGARFHHFLQPDIYIESKWSVYEETMMKYTSYPGARDAFMTGRDLLMKGVVQLNTVDSSSTDLSGIFADSGQEVYLDFCHVAHEGNRIIAAHIFNTLVERKILR